MSGDDGKGIVKRSRGVNYRSKSDGYVDFVSDRQFDERIRHVRHKLALTPGAACKVAEQYNTSSRHVTLARIDYGVEKESSRQSPFLFSRADRVAVEKLLAASCKAEPLHPSFGGHHIWTVSDRKWVLAEPHDLFAYLSHKK